MSAGKSPGSAPNVKPTQPPAHSPRGLTRVPAGAFRCCKHCAEDPVHDVEDDQHEVPCQSCAYKTVHLYTGRQYGKTAIVDEIRRLIDDLDKARADGTIYTYGNVQERLREMVKGYPDDQVPV